MAAPPGRQPGAVPRGDPVERGRVRESRGEPGRRGRGRRVAGRGAGRLGRRRRPARSWPAATTPTWSGSTTGPGSRSAPMASAPSSSLAEQLGRWDTVGIDCVAMNVNDVDLRRGRAAGDGRLPRGRSRGPRGRRRDRRRARPRGRACRDRDRRRRARPARRDVNGLDLAGACFGAVALDSLVTGASIEPGDAVIGLPSSGLHSNGYTLARSALGGIPLDDERLGRPARRGAAGADRDLRQGRSSSCCAPRSTVRGPRPHHLGRPRQPAAARRPRSATRSTIRCRCHRSSG